VREGCLLEEEANGAHCVGLKQTILFPFVTLGSLINFCDCLMAGGTSRKDHSEVGSSYIHFNYTPDGDKTTASLFGDVPRGVMLNQPPIFLGGQGGAVGPLRLGYGTVIAAGSVLREDVVEDRKLVFVPPPPGLQRGHSPHVYKNLNRIVRNNVAYLANLVALEEWYRSVRHSFLSRQEMGELVYAGALELLAAAKDERAKRLEAMAEKVPEVDSGSAEFRARVGVICDLFRSAQAPVMGQAGEDFLTAFQATSGWSEGEYVSTIQGLGEDVAVRGSSWLQEIVDGLCRQAGALVPALGLSETRA
jgi:UDP-N-acetylglucosamine/UDP-N-acetylgalactosamine diphosphorylase